MSLPSISANLVKFVYVMLAVWLGGGGLLRAEYQAPDLKKPLLERGNLALDADAMKSLAESLVDLQGTNGDWTPKLERRHAKIVVLASFLDRGNESAARLNEKLIRGEQIKGIDEKRRRRAMSRLWQNVRWLSSEEAGEASNLLSAYLLDIMVELDPDHPLTKAHDLNGEFGRWKTFVAPLRDFAGDEAKKPAEEPPKPAPVTPTETEKNPTTGREKTAALRASGPVTIYGIGRLYDSKQTKTYPAIVTMKLRGGGNKNSEEKGFNLKINPGDQNAIGRLIRETKGSLFRRYSQEGKWNVVAETSFAPARTAETMESLELPLLLGVEALINGRKVRENLIAFGQVNGAQEVVGANSWWDSIAALRNRDDDEPPMILLVPDNVAADFVNLIALEEPEFFLHFECFRVKTIDDAFAFALGELPESTENAIALFDEIQALAKKKSLKTMAQNRFVRAKLQQALKANPNFLSAEMLLVQGSGRRPRTVSSTNLALQMRSLLRGADWALSFEPKLFRKGDRAMKTFNSLRERADELERFVGISDREFFASGLEVINSLRSIDREIRLADRKNNAARGSIRQAQEKSKAVKAKIRTILGEKDPDALIIPQ